MNRQIKHYDDFVAALMEAGFSLGNGNNEDVYAILSWGWNEEPPYETPVRWHTEDKDTDPWEWRIRVLDEGKDIAYSKMFFKKSGYMTRAWAPYFLAVRRAGMSFDEAYADGTLSHAAKRIYQVIAQHGALPLHAIKELAGFAKEEKSLFDRTLTELQMKLYITMCGRQQKISQKGEEYGWSSTVFCTTEVFWGEDVFARAGAITPEEAAEAITEQVYRLNSQANAKKIARFIKG